MKRTIFICITFLFVVIIVGVATSTSKHATTTSSVPTAYATEAMAAAAGGAAEVAAAPVENWEYQSSTSEITGKPESWACTVSSDRGGTKFCFRRMGGVLNAYLQLPDTLQGGQFFCYEDHCSAQIKVDDRGAYSIEGREETSGNSRVMFLPASTLLANAKKAKTIKIAAPFYSEGHQTLHFDVAGLKF